MSQRDELTNLICITTYELANLTLGKHHLKYDILYHGQILVIAYLVNSSPTDKLSMYGIL